MTNPTQINQGGAQNQERQPKQQTGSHARKATQDQARRVVEGGEQDQQSKKQRNQAGDVRSDPARRGGIGGP